MADIFEISGRIHSTSQEHVTSPADEILDTSQNKKQHLINADVARHESEINSPTNGLNKRVADIEALGQIGDTPVETNASNIINNTSLNGKVPSASAVNGVYNSVVANAGYYTCDSEASTAAKVVEASGYVLTIGGCIKIKMTNANTADDDATLNINSTGAKALYYAGERASATNSWEEGETVEVYYDGTSYYANNVAGGSGSGDGAFDVSDKYPTSGVDGGNTYTLELALSVLNANLSIRKKKGGMSIKFISSIDHKYVQFRYMGTSTANDGFTNVANWQGVNITIIAKSNNLPKSGAVAEITNEVFELSNKALDEIGTERTIEFKPFNYAGIIYNGTSVVPATIEYDGYVLPLQNKCTYTFSNTNSRGMYYADGHGYTQQVTSPYTANFAVDGFKYILFSVPKGSSLTVEKTVEQGIVKQLSDLTTREINHYNNTTKQIRNVGNAVLGEALILGKETSIVLTKEYYYGVIYDGSALVAATNSFNSFCIKVEKGCTYNISPNVTNVRFTTAKPVIGGSVGTIVSSFPYTATANGYLLFSVATSVESFTLGKDISGVYKEFNDYKKGIGDYIKVNIPVTGTNAYINGQRQTITPQALQGFAYTLVKVNVGETYRIYGKGDNEYSCLYTVRDSSYNVIQRKNAYDSRGTGLDVTIEPGGEYLCVNFAYYSVDTDYVQQVYTHEETINNLLKRNHIDFADKTIVCFGDSITEFKGAGKGYCDYIADFTGANVINVGIGGTQMRQRQTWFPATWADEDTWRPSTDGTSYSSLDGINLIKAVVNNDFRYAEAGAEWLKNNYSDDNTEIIARLKAIDFNDIDIVTFFYGANDYNSYASGEPTCNMGIMGTINDITTLGAMAKIIKLMLTAYPHLKIYFLTPLPAWQTSDSSLWTEDNLNEYWAGFKENGEGKTRIDYVDAIIQQAKYYCIPVCDMYRTIGWNWYNLHNYLNASGTDGQHPYRGFDVIAKRIVSFIQSNWI